MRAMRLAEKFSRAVIVFVRYAGGIRASNRRSAAAAEAIAVNLRDMMVLDTPVIVIISGRAAAAALSASRSATGSDAGARDL